RSEVESAPLARRVELDLGWEGRPRSNDPHLPAENVDQVGELVKREAAKQAADVGDPGVLRDHGCAYAHRIGSAGHRPQLEHFEDDTPLADAALPVEDWAPRLELDREGGNRKQRREDDQTGDRHQDVRPAGKPLLRRWELGEDREALLPVLVLPGVCDRHRVPSTFSQPIGTRPAPRRSQTPTAIDAVTGT